MIHLLIARIIRILATKKNLDSFNLNNRRAIRTHRIEIRWEIQVRTQTMQKLMLSSSQWTAVIKTNINLEILWKITSMCHDLAANPSRTAILWTSLQKSKVRWNLIQKHLWEKANKDISLGNFQLLLMWKLTLGCKILIKSIWK